VYRSCRRRRRRSAAELILGREGQPPPERGKTGDGKSGRGEEHGGDALGVAPLRSPVEEEHGEERLEASPLPSREESDLGFSFPTSRVADGSPGERSGRARVHPPRGQPNGNVGCPGAF
jgi:hypothetical protein